MVVRLALNYPAPIPVGHTVEVTEYADTRPERKRRGFDAAEAFRHPTVRDLDSGILYMNHVHASAGPDTSVPFLANDYPVVPREELVVARVWRGRVTACALVHVEGPDTQHTALRIDED